MVKPRPTNFGDAFERVMVGAWRTNEEKLRGRLLEDTWEAIKTIRRVYRFKNVPYPSRLKFSLPKNMAGYLGAFGERHAYLTYHHLKNLENIDAGAIPVPDSRGEITATVIGAGAAMELYGLCLYYNERHHNLKVLKVNLLEKVDEWKPVRQTVIWT